MKVMLVADPGIDDAMAIYYALFHPQIEVVGIVAQFGNTRQQQSVENTKYILKLAGRDDVPVIEGAAFPLHGEVSQFGVQGASGLGPYHPKNVQGIKTFPFEKMFGLIERYEKQLVIVTLSPLTSVAIGFLLYKKVMQKVLAFYMMGGAFLVPGNVTPMAEFNFYSDPSGADIVLKKANHSKVFPLNVTMRATVSQSEIFKVIEDYPHELKQFIYVIMTNYFNLYNKLNLRGAPLHDVVPLSALMNPSLFDGVSRRARVEVEGNLTKGVSVADFRMNDHTWNQNRDSIALQLNHPAFISDYLRVMSRASV